MLRPLPLLGLAAAAALLAGCRAEAILWELPEPLPPVADGLCGFEDNDLEGFRLAGESWIDQQESGGRVAIVAEGDEFSALRGEESLEFPGDRAAMLRPHDAGDLEDRAVLTTNPFEPVSRYFVMDQLSEVGEDGIRLELRFLDAEDRVLELRELPVLTGGFVPALRPEHSPIVGFEDIGYGDPQSGSFVRTYIDLAPWHEMGPISLEFRQHTRVQDQGFFTLLDNLCNGDPGG